jgi:uncharacterized protein YndB with AHSA1/START domain
LPGAIKFFDMPNILHRILIKSSPENVFRAFSTMDGLRHWWTENSQASEELKTGTVIRFRFGDEGPDMKIARIVPNKRMEWECISGPSDWTVTKLFFDVEGHKGMTILHFGQTGWREENDFFMHCNCRWGYFMVSIKNFIETGQGNPWPRALEI